jgi:phosphocarrier protein HPr
MKQATVVVVNKLGLHARPSAALSQTASRFKSEVWMSKGSRRINAKSIMGVMMLAAARGAKLVLSLIHISEPTRLM